MPQTEINFVVFMFLKSPLVSLLGSEKEEQTASITVKRFPLIRDPYRKYRVRKIYSCVKYQHYSILEVILFCTGHLNMTG